MHSQPLSQPCVNSPSQPSLHLESQSESQLWSHCESQSSSQLALGCESQLASQLPLQVSVRARTTEAGRR